MLARVAPFGLCGLQAYPVVIEVDISPGLPQTTLVGLPDNAVKESRERIRAAIKNSGFEFPAQRITINLAPADTKKQGPCYDLAKRPGSGAGRRRGLCGKGQPSIKRGLEMAAMNPCPTILNLI